MSMMTLQVLKSVDFKKAQKLRYLEKKSKNKKNSLITHQGLLYGKKILL